VRRARAALSAPSQAHSIDPFLDRLLIDPKPCPAFGGGGARRIHPSIIPIVFLYLTFGSAGRHGGRYTALAQK
jgi:hypothetical protein